MTTATETKTFGFYLDGRWRTDGERIEIFSPGTRELAGTTYRASAKDLQAAIAAATRAFDLTRKMGGYERQRVLRGVAQRLETQREDLARTLALEAGKPIKSARRLPLPWQRKKRCASAANIYRWIGKLPPRDAGESFADSRLAPSRRSHRLIFQSTWWPTN